MRSQLDQGYAFSSIFLYKHNITKLLEILSGSGKKEAIAN